jgi:nucleoside-diphosphate-sugar epimerase
MKILIAGGAGYVGSVLVPELQKLGHVVDVVDLLWFGNNLPKDIVVIQKNIMDLVPKDVEKYEQVIFLAGMSNDPMAEFSPKDNFIQNAAVPTYLAFISKQARVRRFIFASSCSLYGYAADKIYSEEDKVFSSHPYGISKIQAEYIIDKMADEKFSTICLRKGTISGYSPRMRFDLVINTMFKACMINKKITVNNATIWRPILSIKDAVNGYIGSINAPYEISGVFNLISKNYTIIDIALSVRETLNRILNIKDIEIDIKNIQDFRNYRVTDTKAKEILHLYAKNDADDIVENLIAHKHFFEDYNAKKYYNIEIFKTIQV